MGDWCKEHWKELLITVVIVIGAVLAIAAVICSGGLALVPMLTALLTTLGVSAAMATTIATVASLTIAGIAIVSTLGSSALNIVDTWCDMSENSTFKSWQTAMNWISIISNGLYSIGAIYNSVAAKLANVGGTGSNYNIAKKYGIDIENLNVSKSVQNHTGRPYQNFKSLINEIIEYKPPVRDPRGTNAWSWTVEGSFNNSIGIYELVIDPVSNTVWHFVFKSY